MWWPAIRWSHKSFQSASPRGDQAPCIKRQAFGVFQKKKPQTQRTAAITEGHHFIKCGALRASFSVVNCTARAKKPFTTGEELVLPVAKDICCELLGKTAGQKAACVPLSASTMTRWTDETAEDIEAQLLERINAAPWYAMQADEPTDAHNKATMLVSVWYIFQENMHEDVLSALLLPTKTRAAELFKPSNDYIPGKPNWSFLCRCMHRQSSCPDWTTFWFHCSGERGHFRLLVYTLCYPQRNAG